MNNPTPKHLFGRTINRIADVMAHTDRFAFRGSSRLALDAGVSPSSITRLLHGEINPSFLLISRVRKALELQLGFPIDMGDLVAESGEFRTRFVCDAVGCKGCLPDQATDDDANPNPLFKNVQKGQWVTAKYPAGFAQAKGGL